VQATLRVVRAFWGLDDRLASQRHFPAIDWLTSYSLYQGTVDEALKVTVDANWQKNRTDAMALLQREAELEEIVRLVGVDALSPADRLTMQAAKMVREDFLHQNAFDEIDTYTSLEKQFMMLDAILEFYRQSRKAIEAGVPFDRLVALPVLEEISRAKLIREIHGKVPVEELAALKRRVTEQVDALTKG
jgi:V/A-type H+-transporting ATPase subunit A